MGNWWYLTGPLCWPLMDSDGGLPLSFPLRSNSVLTHLSSREIPSLADQRAPCVCLTLSNPETGPTATFGQPTV